MSAYGEIKRAHNAAPLLPTEWKGLAAANAEHGTHITVHHLTLASARALPGLIAYLSAVFAQEVEDGMTYPQEGDMSQTTFEAYFFAADVFIGLIGQLTSDAVTRTATSLTDDYTTGDIETQRGGRNWDQCVAGFYYVGVSAVAAQAVRLLLHTQRQRLIAWRVDKTKLSWPFFSRASRALYVHSGNSCVDAISLPISTRSVTQDLWCHPRSVAWGTEAYSRTHMSTTRPN